MLEGGEMDPVTLIVTALEAGAAAAGTDAAKDAVLSLYGRLKTALTAKAGRQPAWSGSSVR
jgi:hypothetical protein